ncbi:MAG: sporulation protein YqfD [Clostridia bacterium]
MISRAIISVSGFNSEKFINVFAKKGIHIYEYRKIKKSEGFLTVCYNDRKISVDLLTEMCYNAKIVDVYGVKPFAKKLFSEWLILLSAIIAIVISVYFGTVIKKIEISTAGITDKESVLLLLQEQGVKIGVPLKEISIDYLENKLAVLIPKVEYAFIEIKGATIFVTLTPKAEHPIEQDKEPRDIIALSDGIVSRIVTLKGTALVKKGDSVKKGQILIKGVTTYNDNTTSPIYAEGRIYAKVESCGEAVFIPYKTEYKRTGKKIEFTEFDVLWRRVESHFKKSFVLQEEERSSIILAPMPIIMYKVTLYELASTLIATTFEQEYLNLKAIAEQIARKNAKFEIESVRFETIQLPQLTVKATVDGTAVISG